jgi:alkylation response protein AidB-like acyl-CoA dehydrogenase
MFTSTSHEASHVILLTRTDTELPKHRGLMMFMVPLYGPGIEIREIRTLSGERTFATLGRDLDAAFLAIVVTTIYGGASGILRDQIAGPRCRPAD